MTKAKSAIETKNLADLIGCGVVAVDFMQPRIKRVGTTTPCDLGADTTKVITRMIKYGGKDIQWWDENSRDHYMPGDVKVLLLEESAAAKKLKSYIDNAKVETIYWQSEMGTDPEIFAVNGKGELIPAFKFLGSKESPTLADKQEGTAPGRNKCYWDGFQAEFDTRPLRCLAWLTDSIHHGLLGVYKAAKQHDPKARLTIKNLIELTDKDMQGAKEEHIQFGCSPSMNAYGHRSVEIDGSDTRLRCAGGHVHFSMPELKKEGAIELVKTLDAVLGVACVSLFQSIDDQRRRMLYGMAGEFRMPAHGLEYRVLSNAWLCHPAITHLTLELARAAVALGERGLRELWKCTEDEAIDIINTCDVSGAQSVIKKNQPLLEKLLRRKLGDNSTTCIDVLLRGVGNVVRDPDDIVGNWCLEGEWITHSGNKNCTVASAMPNIRDKKLI